VNPQLRLHVVVAALALCLGACSTLPPQLLTPREELEPEAVPAPTMLIEYPPIEPVEPPLAEVEPAPAAAAVPESEKIAMVAPAAVPSRPAPSPPEPSLDDQQFLALLTDLQRYGSMSPDDVRRELTNATQALARQRTEIGRAHV